MPAYSLTEVEIVDGEGAQRYAELAQASVAHHGGRFHVLAAEAVVAEGTWPSGQRVVIIEFPGMDRLRAWYDSPEYAPAREIARTALRRSLVFVEGIDAPDPAGDAAAPVRRFYEAMHSGDTTAVDDILTADWEDIPLPPGITAGPEGFKATVSFLTGAFPDLSIAIEDMVVSGDRVAVRVLARGTHKGEILGVAATGRKVEFRAFEFHRLVGGKIAQSWHMEDSFALLNQLQAAASEAHS